MNMSKSWTTAMRLQDISLQCASLLYKDWQCGLSWKPVWPGRLTFHVVVVDLTEPTVVFLNVFLITQKRVYVYRISELSFSSICIWAVQKKESFCYHKCKIHLAVSWNVRKDTFIGFKIKCFNTCPYDTYNAIKRNFWTA